MILIKGTDVKFEMADGRILSLPPKHGIIHDPSGQALPRCDVYFGPFQKGRTPIDLPTKEARAYFGRFYDARAAVVDVPPGPWKPVGDVTQIFYVRPGVHQGRYYHLFREGNLLRLSRCRAFHRLDLPEGCVVNDRGFVKP